MKTEELTPKDLRIGNIVALGSMKLTVYEIHEDCYYVKDINGSSYKNKWADLQPIPLSEDVMLKCPEIQPSTWMAEMWTIRDPKSQFHIVKMKGRFVFRGLGMSIVYVDTLHHLQNLVYAVTGEELEVKLSS